MIAVVAACTLASGCSAMGANSASLARRCERSLPAMDAAAATVATVLAFTTGSSSNDGDPDGGSSPNVKALAVGLAFGLSAGAGFSKAARCRARPPQVEVRDRFLGARRWASSISLVHTESTVVALERAYQRAAVVCEGRGFSSLRSTPLGPWRPRWITLVYQCH